MFDLLTHWGAIELDLHDRHIDVEDQVLMRSRSWRWLQSRIYDIALTPDSRLRKAITEGN